MIVVTGQVRSPGPPSVVEGPVSFSSVSGTLPDAGRVTVTLVRNSDPSGLRFRVKEGDVVRRIK